MSDLYAERRYNTLQPFGGTVNVAVVDFDCLSPHLLAMSCIITNQSASGASCQDMLFGNSYQGNNLHISILFALLDIVGAYVSEFIQYSTEPFDSLLDYCGAITYVDPDHMCELTERVCDTLNSETTAGIDGHDLPTVFYSSLSVVISNLLYVLVKQVQNVCQHKFQSSEALKPVNFHFELASSTTIMIGVSFE